ncbi:hypothetical protein C8R47DRAFT_1166884 [Mycena vitilis]|nr:hypothetical protein C8R47DRAFT_1166884 [Mycena vitilis]
MTITPDSDSKLKDVGAQPDVVNRTETPVSSTSPRPCTCTAADAVEWPQDDPPPAYTHTDSKASVPAPLLTAEPPLPLLPPSLPPILTPPATVKPTNYLSLSRGNESIKGTYVIDPRVALPPFLLPPLAPHESEATRRNVFLHTSNGSIDVDLFVVRGAVASESGAEGKKEGEGKEVDMLVKSSNGSITVKLHAPPAPRPPLHLTATSSNGTLTLHLPHSFRGPLTLRTRNGSVRIVRALEGATTTVSEAGGVRRCFVGEFADWAERPEGWTGDEVTLESANGSIRVQYDVEVASTAAESAKDSGKGKGLFGRLLGL